MSLLAAEHNVPGNNMEQDQDDWSQIFARILDEYMRVNELETSKVADRLGVDKSMISKYRRGISEPRFGNGMRMLNVMWGVDVWDLAPSPYGQAVREVQEDDGERHDETILQMGVVSEGGNAVAITTDPDQMRVLAIDGRGTVRGGRGMKYSRGTIYALRVADDSMNPHFPNGATLLVREAKPDAVQANGCEVILGRMVVTGGKPTAKGLRMVRLGETLEADGKAVWVMAQGFGAGAHGAQEQLKISDIHVAWVVCGAIFAR